MLTIFLIVLAYVAVSMLCWFVMPLTEPRKAVFSFTIFPVLAVGAFLSIWFVDSNYPGILDSFDVVKRLGRKKGSAVMHPFMLLAPGTALAGFLWIVLFGILEHRSKGRVDVDEVRARIKRRQLQASRPK